MKQAEWRLAPALLALMSLSAVPRGAPAATTNWTCTTSTPLANMTCDATWVNDTTLTNPGFVARDKVSLTATVD